MACNESLDFQQAISHALQRQEMYLEWPYHGLGRIAISFGVRSVISLGASATTTSGFGPERFKGAEHSER